jgi:glycosyltransferase involved in cell wall biosynthesis
MTANVLMLSTSYPADATDWRGAFMRPLVDALARADGMRLALWAPPGPLPANVVDATTADDARWLARLMARGGISHLIRHPSPSSLLAPFALLHRLRAAYRRHAAAGLYHVNWLQCALPLPDNGVPALVSALGNDLALLKLPLMRAALRRAMRRRRVAICPNAEWMRAPLADAFGDIAEIVPVVFGIDAGWFRLERRTPDVPTWIVVSRLTADKLGPLFDWSAPLFEPGRRELHVYGPMQEPIAVPDWVHYHGAASAAQLMHEVFPRATGLVSLSRHAEGRPQVMLEAMAAGLPIIASAIAAHGDVVRDGLTGLLCATPDDYAQALDRLERPQETAACDAAARAPAAAEYGTWDDCAQRYLAVHTRLRAGVGA